MDKEKFINALSTFYKQNYKYPIYLLGTGNLMLRGVDVKPNDIDFITNSQILKEIADNYEAVVIKNEVGYFETEIKLDDIEYHIVSNDGNPIRPDNLSKNATTIKLNNYELKGLTLESEKRAYKKMGRAKDINKIELIDRVLLA